MDYIFEHEGKQYSPDGIVSVPDMTLANKQTELDEIERLKMHPERLFLYVSHARDILRSAPAECQITTWLGTVLDARAHMGPSREFPCFGPFSSRRRAVRCVLFGVAYHGWYMESSGNYVRLKRSKHNG